MTVHFAKGSTKVFRNGNGKSPTRCDRDVCRQPLIDTIGGWATCSRGHRLPLIEILAIAAHKGLLKGLHVAEIAGVAGMLVKLRRDLGFLPTTNQYPMVLCSEVNPATGCDGVILGKKLGPIEEKGGIQANRGGIVHVCTDGETHFAPLLPLVRAYVTKHSCPDVFALAGILTDRVVALAAKEQGDLDRIGRDLEFENPDGAREARAHAKRVRHAGQGRPEYAEVHA